MNTTACLMKDYIGRDVSCMCLILLLYNPWTFESPCVVFKYLMYVSQWYLRRDSRCPCNVQSRTRHYNSRCPRTHLGMVWPLGSPMHGILIMETIVETLSIHDSSIVRACKNGYFFVESVVPFSSTIQAFMFHRYNDQKFLRSWL